MNEANQANFDEIDGHIKIIKAKMAKSTDHKQESLAEDLEDYYERKLQLRVMRNNDLTSELAETQQVAARLRWHLWRLGGLCAAVVVVATVIAALLLCPATVQQMIRSSAVRHVAIIGSTTAVGSGVTWLVMRR